MSRTSTPRRPIPRAQLQAKFAMRLRTSEKAARRAQVLAELDA